MDPFNDKCAALQARIAATEAKLAELKQELARARDVVADARNQNPTVLDESNGSQNGSKWPLSQKEYKRYGRQMIVSQVGLSGQLKLKAARVLLVGAGGLGCPAAQYLAGAGVGTLGLIDGDTVEVSNLHRQVLHRTRNVGMYKVDSAIESLKELNPHPNYVAHRTHLTPGEAPEIFAQYDLILDCTDNPATRYLISDTAVLLGKPLVSASALRTEGQLMVLNNPPRPPGDKSGGPCYRCVFPKPPPADSVVSCADGGILGPVVGTMGVLQALEAIKVITAIESSAPESPLLHMFSAYSNPLCRTIRIRSRRTNCAVCSAEATVSLDTITSGSMDYVFFCGSANPPALLRKDERVSARQYRELSSQSDDSFDKSSLQRRHTIIDVRDKTQFEICHLENSINIPISDILASASTEATPSWVPTELVATDSKEPVYVVCRLGNDSQLAVQRMKELGLGRGGQRFIGDIQGGLRAWREQVDPEWPEY
ncbi:Adenylyltransferase and sulfurtransferase uba4 [Penicillium diatomitis]|uniref:Adenylyltransferase and sulfurtransferase uba4 n=1 Tax=Penicillium diatomitis TaxID=2819901 RepID=A0A9X0BV42_9EURO|nr:Adenylyltransferase and sulfurtransferase uba4 [Penicillium diatomitis]KAJ5485506.1 Adenylyltransferase and sulfurtransferase uba4 [Penicillium diatomitis]